MAEEPDDAEWLLWLGKLHQLRHQDGKALEIFRRLLEEDPDNLEARQALVEIYLQQHAWAQAVEPLENLSRQRPQDARIMRSLALAYFELGRWDEARGLLDELARRRRDDALTHFMRGALYRRKGFWNLAVAELIEAARSPDLRSEASLELAGVYAEQNEKAKAAEWLRQARQDLPEDATHLLRYAVTALRLEDFSEALATLQRAEKLGAPDGQFYLQLGRAYLGLKRVPEAIKTWLRAAALEPHGTEAWNYLAYTCAERALRLNEAETWARRAVAEEPENGNYHDTLGWVLYKQGNYSSALAELERALACFKARGETLDPVVYEHLGDTYEKLRRQDEALQAWRQALQANPSNTGLAEKVKAHTP